ncbi:MAG TPA: PepSY-like domain-containing protein [Chitinophagaceae bacterium]|nr:PepSY-like domain-containing protein [Chitinophagaceae bacterium]
MKNNFLVLVAAIAIGLSSNCQSIKVPAAVKSAFNTKYPNATNVKWGKENTKEYEAEFKLNGTNVSANFALDGSWVETETVIKIASLPAPVTAALKKKYPGAVITMAEKLEMPGGKLLYEATFKVNGKKKSMELNPDGSLAK